jgi:hypothetical protein
MVIEAINDFRTENGRGRILYWNSVENAYCQLHSLHMSHIEKLEHTPFYYLSDRSEIVAVSNFAFNFRDTVRFMIYVLFGESPKHKEVLLNCERLSYGVIVDKGKVYLTIRGY